MATHSIPTGLSLATCAALCLAPAAFGQEQQDHHPLQGHRVIETRANTYTYNRQQDQSLAADREGNFLVTWGSRRQEHGTFGVFAQLLDPLGRPLGTELHVNEYLPGNQVDPAVAFGPASEAWVAWCSIPGQDGSLGGIYLRRLAWQEQEESGGLGARFAPAGGEILVNESTLGDQQDPAVLVNDDGDVLVAWVSDHLGRRAVFARWFDAFGVARGGEFRLGETSEGHEGLPVLSRLDADRAVAAWAEVDAIGRPAGLSARLLDAAGAPAGPSFRLNEADGRQHVEPSVDADASGRFVAAWMSSSGDGEYDVTVRRFDRDGQPLGAQQLLARGDASYRNGAAVTVAPDGRFLVAWNEHHGKVLGERGRPEAEVSIDGQIFDASGLAVGAALRLNQDDAGEQTLQVGLNARRAAWTALDQVALAWHGSVQGDERGVGVTLFAPPELNPPVPPHVEPLACEISAEQFRSQADLAPPEWDPNWVPDGHLPNPPPAGPDFGFNAFTSTGWTPPDPDLAVGPNHIVVVVNVAMKFFTKTGTQTFSTNLEPFFNTTGFVFDPVALYDTHANRFVIAAAEHAGSTDYFDIAVSDDNDPNGTWHKYRVNVNSLCDFIDFENLGVDANAYYVMADCFGSPSGNYIHAVNKSSILSGGTLSKTSIQTSSSLLSLSSTKNYDNPSPGGYFVTAWTSSSNLRIYSVTNPTAGATLHQTNVSVGSFSDPPDAQQLGTSNQADTIDDRTKNGVVRNGVLYVCHNVNGGDGAAKVRWYKIDLRGWPNSGNTPTLLDSGRVNDGTNVDSWFGDVNVDAQGNMAIAYNRSSPSQYIGVYRTFRLASDPPGTVQAGVEMQLSTSPETGSRWGDYAGLEEDPVDPSTFWNHHEYRTTSWRTWVGSFEVGGGGGVTLTVSSLVRGTTATATVSGAAAGETVDFYYTTAGTGAGPCYPQYGGLCLDLLNPVKSGGSAVANASGVATVFPTVPASAPLVTIYAQAAIARGVGGVSSVKTNVASQPIQ